MNSAASVHRPVPACCAEFLFQLHPVKAMLVRAEHLVDVFAQFGEAQKPSPRDGEADVPSLELIRKFFFRSVGVFMMAVLSMQMPWRVV